MANRVVTRTVRARISNHSAVSDDLDSLGFAASKLWNVARWTAERIWSETGLIPGHAELSAYLKHDGRYADLHSQSSQRVIQELAEAFASWSGHRQAGNENTNPPGYRKRGDQHPRSTVTFKMEGFKHHAKFGRVRLSKGQNLKESIDDFVRCEYEVIGPPGTPVKDVQQVRAVYEHGEWRLHFVCRVVIMVPESPGDRSAGIDLGICNVAAVSFGDETLLFPGNSLKEDLHYFTRAEYNSEGRDGPSMRALWARRKKGRRKRHFLHALTSYLVAACVERDVGEIAIGLPKHIREGDWGRHGNKRLHTWAFEKFIQHLEYKAEESGIIVTRVDEAAFKTSKTCCNCGMEADANRVERGLYVCRDCGLVANADCNAAENMRATLTPNPVQDRSNGCLAQPGVYLFDESKGQFAPREQVVCKP